jgi:hypothetical protein
VVAGSNPVTPISFFSFEEQRLYRSETHDKDPSFPNMKFLDKIPYPMLLLLCVFLGLAPFFPEPHLWEKLKLLQTGHLTKPIDIFDLLYHSAPLLVLGLKLWRGNQKDSAP